MPLAKNALELIKQRCENFKEFPLNVFSGSFPSDKECPLIAKPIEVQLSGLSFEGYVQYQCYKMIEFMDSPVSPQPKDPSRPVRSLFGFTDLEETKASLISAFHFSKLNYQVKSYPSGNPDFENFSRAIQTICDSTDLKCDDSDLKFEELFELKRNLDVVKFKRLRNLVVDYFEKPNQIEEKCLKHFWDYSAAELEHFGIISSVLVEHLIEAAVFKNVPQIYNC